MGFIERIQTVYGKGSCVGLKVKLLKEVEVPEKWSRAIQEVYGERWDEDIKASGYVLERAYLSCLATLNKLELAEDPLWGPKNSEQDELWRQNMEEHKIQIMATKLGASYGQTILVQDAWATLLFYFSALSRMCAKMGYEVKECPYCGKQGIGTKCECGFPGTDPIDFIKNFTSAIEKLAEEGRLIAISSSVDHPGVSWLDNGKFRWDDFTETEEGNIVSRYSKNGFTVFRPLAKTFKCTNTSCGGLISPPRDPQKYKFVKVIWVGREIASVGGIEPVNGEYMYSLGNQSRGKGYFAWLREGITYKAKKALMSYEEEPEEIIFSLDSHEGVEIYYSPYSIYGDSCSYAYGEMEIPEDVQWLENEEGLRVIHEGIMPRGVTFKIAGGDMDGQTISIPIPQNVRPEVQSKGAFNLIPRTPAPKNEDGPEVHLFGVHNVIDSCDGVQINGWVHSSMEETYWRGHLKFGKKYTISVGNEKRDFFLDNPGEIRVRWSPSIVTKPGHPRWVKPNLPRDFEKLTTNDGREVFHDSLLPAGIPFVIVGGVRNGETIRVE